MPSPRDLVTVVYRPRETMRRVLDGGRERWTIQIVILATFCSAVTDTDIRHVHTVLPDLALGPMVALLALALILDAVCWIGLLYLVAFAATLVGRQLDGHAEIADVRAALAWSVVPAIWCGFLRIPLAIYAYRLVPPATNPRQLVLNFVANGGCTFAILALTFEVLLYAWVGWVASSTVAEALRFSTWKGLATIAI
ncbi:MAG TPA: YIP1 family protein, partial [Thermoanaerobaculia bacterium]